MQQASRPVNFASAAAMRLAFASLRTQIQFRRGFAQTAFTSGTSAPPCPPYTFVQPASARAFMIQSLQSRRNASTGANSRTPSTINGGGLETRAWQPPQSTRSSQPSSV